MDLCEIRTTKNFRSNDFSRFPAFQRLKSLLRAQHPTGDQSPVYEAAPDQSGFAGLIQRRFVARKFISSRAAICCSTDRVSVRPNLIWPRKTWAATLLSLLMLFSSPVSIALADHPSPGSVPLESVNYEQKLNAQVPLELNFRDESGQTVQLGRYFGVRPVVFLFAYYECPMLCTVVLNHLTESLKKLQFTPGDQFEIVTVSMDPGETPESAAAKKATYMNEYGRPGAEKGWHFLTGNQADIDRLAQSVGFGYVYDPEIDQYAHPTGVIILTPEGKVSRYILGIDYEPKDLRLGLVDASQQKIGTPVDQFYLLCYRYDPHTGRYSLVIQNVIRLAGSASVVALGGLVFLLLRRERAGGQPSQNPDHPIKRPQNG